MLDAAHHIRPNNRDQDIYLAKNMNVVMPLVPHIQKRTSLTTGMTPRNTYKDKVAATSHWKVEFCWRLLDSEEKVQETFAQAAQVNAFRESKFYSKLPAIFWKICQNASFASSKKYVWIELRNNFLEDETWTTKPRIKLCQTSSTMGMLEELPRGKEILDSRLQLELSRGVHQVHAPST